jgi:two-component system C4-dicarboxylate transport response regulator DctD
MPATPYVVAVVRESSDFALLSAELAELGVGTRHAKTPSEASMPQEAPASVILCDVDGVDWVEALRLFRQNQPAAPVVFLTRLADEQLWIQMLDAGAYDLLEKPYRPQDLRWIVSSALKRAHPLSNTAVA